MLVRNKHGFTMYQFSSHKNITEMLIRTRDIRILGSYGWFFVYLPCDKKIEKMNPFNAFFHTLRNLFWGYLKKKIYTKKIK